jgi:hypothetical protein
MKTLKRLAVFLMVLISSSAAQSAWHADSPPVIGSITTQMDETIPSNRSRKEMAIGEGVTCSVDPSTWADYDKNDSQQCDIVMPGPPITDTLGGISWSTTGDLTSSNTGNSIHFAAPILAADGNIHVLMTAVDSGTHGSTESVQKSVDFTVRIPTSVVVIRAKDNVPAARSINAAGTLIGQSGIFSYTVMPDSVNFKHISAHEVVDNSPALNWPNGNPPGTVTFQAGKTAPAAIGDSKTGENNHMVDLVDKFWPKSYIVDANNTPHDFNYSMAQHFEYQLAGGAWKKFGDLTHSRFYRASDYKGIAAVSGFYQPNWQGPWQ